MKAREEEKKTKEEARKRKAEERGAMRAEQTEKRKTMTKEMKIANIAAPTKVYPKRRELQGGAAYQEISKDMCCVFVWVCGRMTWMKKRDALCLVVSGYNAVMRSVVCGVMLSA